MATLTIRNVRSTVVRSLKSLARKNGHSMEQEIREVLEEYVADRRSILERIEAAWAKQRRRPHPAEIEQWIRVGRR